MKVQLFNNMQYLCLEKKHDSSFEEPIAIIVITQKEPGHFLLGVIVPWRYHVLPESDKSYLLATCVNLSTVASRWNSS